MTVYQPLTEIIDFHGRKYYTTATREKLEKEMKERENIWFDFSNRGVRTSQIVNYWPADPDVVELEWRMRDLSSDQRACVEASKKEYIEMWKGTKPMTTALIERFIEQAKKGKVYSLQR